MILDSGLLFLGHPVYRNVQSVIILFLFQHLILSQFMCSAAELYVDSLKFCMQL